MGFRLAIARLIATPLFTIFSVVSLAAGVVVTTAVYSVVDTVLLADLGVDDAERAAFVVSPYGGRAQFGMISDPDFEDLRGAQTSFASLSAAAAIQPSVASTGHAEIVNAEAVDGAYFSTLGIGARLGPHDSSGGSSVQCPRRRGERRVLAQPPGVGSHDRRTGDSINGQAFEVIGVAPARYRGVFGALRSTRLWIPLATEAQLGTARQPAATPRERWSPRTRARAHARSPLRHRVAT